MTLYKKIHFTLRIAAAMCFIGHGAFGIITKPVWCNYFAVFGIGHDMAYRLMPVLGSVDIMLGVILLIVPFRLIPLWLVCWGIVTALLRPLSGEPFAEFIERAGNFGAPLALLILSAGSLTGKRSPENGAGTGSKFLLPAEGDLDDSTVVRLITSLQLVVFLLMAGHGWLNLIAKPGLIAQYTRIGFPQPLVTARILGLAELLFAFAVLLRPSFSLLLVLLVWKVSSELFYPHFELFEWVERGGSYGTILALALILKSRPELYAAGLLSWFKPRGYLSEG